ncbi:transposase IS4 family protein [Bathymodiolus thermophilus thioautotrophic gill symbiont]|uniref:Transposase IS4 family protein n=1 Tax=Bathymodiolus thermophilus thioautotrophic gill symbiont TaxID=2360 RepID=A0A3G3INH9_9GAMM|nr:IS5 family transposase [Bathymodiolus thermophilus thioautotrophic gill symbiont]AYQ57022.1 transposase IS4 family protein [Bathymodiolus thermophilus thioautotrophic gill symbiont]
MLTESLPISTQNNLFHSELFNQLDIKDPLITLSHAIDWQVLNDAFTKHYCLNNGRPSKPIRLMVGLLILKQLENLSDEAVVMQFKRNPYYQYFCGHSAYIADVACNATELVHFRKRIGVKGFNLIFKMSVELHGKKAQESTVLIDTTVQEKNITYPTDAKLAIKIINRLNKLAKQHGIKQRRTYVKEVKNCRLSIRHFRHVKKRAKAKKALKRLRTIANKLIRELQRKLPTHSLFEIYQKDFLFYQKVLAQQPGDKNKIYALHEPDVYVIAKGKDHKKYEYGNKVSIVSTKDSNIIVGVASHKTNIHDSKTLDTAIAHANANRIKPIQKAVCDRGYVGAKEVLGAEIILPKKPLKRDSRYQRDKKRKLCKRRAAIEPIIGHLKADFRLSRNLLKGQVGDEINVLMAAIAWNLKKWLIATVIFLSLQKIGLFFVKRARILCVIV